MASVFNHELFTKNWKNNQTEHNVKVILWILYEDYMIANLCIIQLPVWNILLTDWTIPLYDAKPCTTFYAYHPPLKPPHNLLRFKRSSKRPVVI